MKKRFLALFLCCVMVFTLLPAALTTAFATGSDIQICDASGQPVSKVTLEQNAKTPLTAVTKTEVTGDYQWQIRVSKDIWANILGADGSELELSYGLVANMLSDKNETEIRCKLTVDSGDLLYSDAVTVRLLQDSGANSDAPAAPAIGTIIREAMLVGEPVIVSAAAPAEDAAPAGDAAPAENAAPVVSAAPAVRPTHISASAPVDMVAPVNDATPDGDPADGSDEPAPQAEYCTVTINYVYKDGTPAAPDMTITSPIPYAGQTFYQDVDSPVIVGYQADKERVEVEVTSSDGAEKTYTVTYSPAEVEFTVKHYQQNVGDDDYTLESTEVKKGFTASVVDTGHEKTYEGFYSLSYDVNSQIAADGSTVVEIYYDRYYYLMNFDLDGGYGVEPIYARYGTHIDVGTPTKAGYTFGGWNPTLPELMPADNTSHTAQWTVGTAKFTVVFWYENANDANYSYAGSYQPENVAPGTTKSSADYKNQSFAGRDNDHFKYNENKAETVTVKGDGSTVLNVYFTRNTYTLTFKNGNNIVKTITAKYQADIHDNFPIKDGKKTIWWKVPSGCQSYVPGNNLGSIDTMPGENITFKKHASESGAKIYYYVETLNGAAGDKPHNGKNYKEYKVIDLTYDYYTRLTYAEEFHPITGFTQGDSNPYLPVGGEVYMKKNNYLYYTRNSYNLRFYNYNGDVTNKQAHVQYEAPLSGYYFVPDYPTTLEQNAYKFVGWYTTAECYPGSEADLSTMKMPAADVTLYAKWVPVTHTVKTYLTKDVLDTNGTPLHTWENVPHGTKATPAPEDPTHGDVRYTFVGWFYTDTNGEEKAFDFANMPVNRDLNLYAKWKTDVLVTYTIKYAVRNEDGSYTYIASDTVGKALAGTTKTFNAKFGEQLEEAYQIGYFPENGVKSITMTLEEGGANTYTFVYVEQATVNYTVRYLEKGTNNELHAPKVVKNTTAHVVVETFEPIKDYLPDAYRKTLVLGTDETSNVITFWYTPDKIHAPVLITHWVQNVDGNGYTEYQSTANLYAVIGETQTSKELEIYGFQYVRGTAEVRGTNKANFTAPNAPSYKLENYQGLELNLYYDRNLYPYEFRFMEQGTTNKVAEPITGTARYQAQVKQNALTVPGYQVVGNIPEWTINIVPEEDGSTAVKNVRTFYYKQDTVDIKYEVVGPTATCGTLDNAQDSKLKVVTDTPKGSTPTAADGFKFVGWFKDEECTVPVDTSWVGANNKLTPGKSKDLGDNVMGYEAATYYAKFEYDVADLTITKTGCEDIDANQSFIFKVTGPNGFSQTVVINGNGSVTLKGLKVGEYTVEETTWSWRYTPQKGTQTITLDPTQSAAHNTVTFVNERTNDQWVSTDAYSKNEFAPEKLIVKN